MPEIHNFCAGFCGDFKNFANSGRIGMIYMRIILSVFGKCVENKNNLCYNANRTAGQRPRESLGGISHEKSSIPDAGIVPARLRDARVRHRG